MVYFTSSYAKKIILFAAAIILLVTGCSRKDSMGEADFVSRTSGISLTVNGKEIMKYAAREHQIAYNASLHQFRLSDDTLNNYFVLTLERIPENTGEVVSGELVYTTDDDILKLKADFSVSKISNGKIWLWNNQDKIGIVVQEIV